MKYLLIAATAFLLCSFNTWHYNLEEAKRIAIKEHKHILLNFSGSDWCGPCIRLEKEIFSNESFQKFSDTTLVLVNADFPRNRKNQLSKAQQQLNEAMADQYNSEGKFPLTLLLNANGKVLKEWEGYPQGDATTFMKEIQQELNADH